MQTLASAGPRFEELEAYRGISALCIVIFHTYQHSRIGAIYVYESTSFHFILRNLDSVVSMFFVLSGFLLSLPLITAALSQSSQQSARDFLIRRAIRIVPLYYVVILLVWTLRYSGDVSQWVDLVEHLTFTQIFDPVHIFWTVGPAWSLAVEVLFYVGLAISAPVIHRVCGGVVTVRQRAFLIACFIAFLVIASLIYKWRAFYVAHLPEENYPVYYGPLAKLDTFALGMMLALVSCMEQKPRLTGWFPALCRLIGLGFVVAIFLQRESSQFVNLFFHSLFGVASLFLLASTVLGERGSVWERLLSHPTLKFLGLISYSVYMWHEPLLIWLSDKKILLFEGTTNFPIGTLLLLVIVVIVGGISYYGIEYPTLHLRYLLTQPRE